MNYICAQYSCPEILMKQHEPWQFFTFLASEELKLWHLRLNYCGGSSPRKLLKTNQVHVNI